MKKKKNKVKENIDYDAMYCEEMMRRLAKKGFKLESYGDAGNGKIGLNFTKESIWTRQLVLNLVDTQRKFVRKFWVMTFLKMISTHYQKKKV